MQQAGYHHANMLADQVRQDITTQNEQLMAMVQSMQNMETNPAPVQPAANAAMTDSVQLEILRLLQTMHQQMNNNGTNGGSNQKNNESNGGNTRNCNRNCRTPDNASFNRTDITKYC